MIGVQRLLANTGVLCQDDCGKLAELMFELETAKLYFITEECLRKVATPEAERVVEA